MSEKAISDKAFSDKANFSDKAFLDKAILDKSIIKEMKVFVSPKKFQPTSLKFTSVDIKLENTKTYPNL